MHYYELSDDSARQQQWTRAFHVVPTSSITRWSCSECGRRGTYPAGTFDVDLEGGAGFPDVLQCGAFPFLIMSERFLILLRAERITSFNEFRIGVRSIQESKLTVEKAPNYFRIEPSGQCMVDFAASGAKISSVCQHCGLLTHEPPVIRRFNFVEGSWDGSDLFRDSRHFERVTFCTQRVVDIALEHCITNCRFERMA
jgi:hypothetical protein